MTQTAQTRRCAGTNKAGEPCGAVPLRNGSLCIAHDKEVQAKVGFGGPQPGSGRPRIPRPTELVVEQIRRRIDEVLDVLWDGLVATKGDGTPDWSARAVFARELLDRGLGKPHQSTEITGADGGPLSIAQVWAGSLNGASSLN